MKKSAYLITVFAGLVIVGAGASGDTLVLRGGETLFGSVMKISEGTLQFRTNVSGQMMVPLDEIGSLTMAADALVSFPDGRQVRGRLALKDGAAHLVAPDGRDLPIELAQVAAVKPDTSGPVSGAEPEPGASGNRLRGSLELGGHWRSGTRDHGGALVRLTLSREAQTYAFRARGLTEVADTDDFPSWFLAETEWELGPQAPVYPAIAVGFERDIDKALAFRANLAVGAGKRFIDDPLQELSGMVGLDVETSRFDADVLWDADRDSRDSLFNRAFRDSDKDRQDLNLRLGLRYRRSILKNSEFAGSLYLYPSLTDFGRFRARSESALLFPVRERLKLKLNLLVDYEGHPEFPGIDQWRTSIGAGVAWDF